MYSMNQVQKGTFHYEPSVNEEGQYVDHLPPPMDKYIKCYCGSNTLFPTLTNLKSHFKTDKHTKHLDFLNTQQKNHLMELNKYKRLSKSQQQLIQQQQDMISTHEVQIETLSKKDFESKQKMKKIRESVLVELD